MNLHADYTRISSAIDYLERNFKSQPNLDDIAGHVHLSPYHFDRLFKRWAGVTPKQFLQFLTLNHAKEVLRNAESVLAAAYDAGLSSGSRLHDLFVNIEAMTPGEYKQGGAGVVIRYGSSDTRFGRCFLATTDRGICSMSFYEDDRDAALENLQASWPNAELIEDRTGAEELIERIMSPEHDTGVPITLHVRGTNFQLQVWQALLKIPAGAVVSYEDLARFMNRPGATRAVSSAIARNPVGYLIPCHRVIRKNGAFGEYHWGSVRKKAMLGWETAREVSNAEFRMPNEGKHNPFDIRHSTLGI